MLKHKVLKVGELKVGDDVWAIRDIYSDDLLNDLDRKTIVVVKGTYGRVTDWCPLNTHKPWVTFYNERFTMCAIDRNLLSTIPA